MKKEQKAGVIAELKETLGKSKAGVVTSYQGIPTTEIVNLRHKLRDSKLELKVVKNTLVRRAATEAGKGDGGQFTFGREEGGSDPPSLRVFLKKWGGSGM